MVQEAHSEGNFYLEPKTLGNVPSVYSLQSVYGIQVAQLWAWDCLWRIWKQRKWLAIFVSLCLRR